MRDMLIVCNKMKAKEAAAGDPINGLKHIHVMCAFNDDLDTGAVIMIGEIGGTADAKLAIMEECGFTVTRNPSEMAKLLKGLLK